MKKHTSKKYTEFSKNTQTFMNAVEKHLINKFGEIEPQWEGLLSMLATQVDLYNKCKEQIKEDGLMVRDRFGSFVKNPLLKVQTDALIQIGKLSQEFGLTPRSVGKINLTNNDEEEFLKELVQ